MAEQPKQEKPAKRRLRGAPETVRERSAKFQQQSLDDKKPSKLRVFLSGFFLPLRLVGRILAKIGRRLGKYRVFRAIGYIFVPPYIRNSWRELRQVTWPNNRKTLRLVWAVIVFSVSFGLIVYGVDTVLDKIFKEIIIK